MDAKITPIDPTEFNSSLYQPSDSNLISTFDVNTSLSNNSNIEFFVYDNNKNLLYSEYNFKNFSILNDGRASGNDSLSQITLNPKEDLDRLGFNQGEFISYYSFLNKKIGSYNQPLYITEISSDRTELRLDSTSLTNLDIVDNATSFINERETSPYFLDFRVNFGDNNTIIANNILLDNEDPNNPTLLVKLYKPLPELFDINSTLWIDTLIEESVVYKITFEEEPIIFNDTLSVKGPNFNLDLKDQINNSTLELSYIDIISTSLSSSHNQINSLLEEKEIDINIDYSDFSNFTHFSSAQTRLENFYFKMELIEQYSSSISLLDSTTSSQTEISSSKATYQNKIDHIITNFDGYDYFLYYSSGSHAWPKINSSQPYQLYKTDSLEVLTWFGTTNESSPLYGGEVLSASLYDNTNPNNLYFSIPEYLREDPLNQPYELFVNMVGQHYDNIWTYYNEITQKYNSDNRLEYGMSKDLVADAIKDFGIKLYQNNFTNDDLFTSFLGLTPEGNIFPFPNITGSFPSPSGYEYVDTLISASNDNIPLDDVNKSIYKRLYHNLPYLLKSKGTLPGLRALITSYGIPDTILRITEYGGKDRVNTNDWDYWQNEFNYAFSTSGSNFISSSWELNNAWNAEDNVPSTLMFRFKTDGLPTQNIPYSQSLWYGDGGSAITLTYTGSAYTTESYSGSIIDPYYQYATLTLYPDVYNNTATASIYLPFFDGEWWSVMVTRTGSQFELYSQNKLLGGGNNSDTIGFSASSSTSATEYEWVNTNTSYFPAAFSTTGPTGYDVIVYDVGIYDETGALASTYSPFTGSYQEIRYYSEILNTKAFDNYTMNPYSIEGNSIDDTSDILAFRASIGGELYTLTSSIHPKVNGSWEVTHSFASHSNFYFDSTPHFISNTEYFYSNQPIIGIKNAISDKIRVENNVLPSGDTLSPFSNLTQQSHASSSYTPNINYLEVAFSPQNEINDDISSQLGGFNIGEYIGNPNQRLSNQSSYLDLDNLRNEYFTKYIDNYNLNDFIRLIKFFDNSLFKMIRDFVPARTSLASGIVIKQHLLERNKYPQPILSYINTEISGTVKPQWDGYNDNLIYNTVGGTGGVINQSSYPSQSYEEYIPTLSGSVTKLHEDQSEFYNGELPGSKIVASSQTLNSPLKINLKELSWKPILFNESTLLNSKIYPNNGEILFGIEFARYQSFFFPSFYQLPVYKVTYIKISKTDGNGYDYTNVLKQINTLDILFNSSSEYTQYKISSITESSNYILYQVEYNELPVTVDNEIPSYYTSASISSTQAFSSSLSYYRPLIRNWETITGDGLNNFTSSLGTYTFHNTPSDFNPKPSDTDPNYFFNQSTDVIIQFTASATIQNIASATNPGNYNYLEIRRYPISTDITVDSPNVGNYYLLGTEEILYTDTPQVVTVYGTTTNTNLGGNPMFCLDQIAVGLELESPNGSPFTLTDIQLHITQSIIGDDASYPQTSYYDSISPEPFIDYPNFSNSDQNPLFNNIINNRLSSIYQDVDYTSTLGSNTPTNQDLILSGSAFKASVQDSNYTTIRSINPRYNGVKSTSNQINKWTSGDTGTLGKQPTIESLKTVVAYCDGIGGWTPDRMDSSWAHIKYLINADGTVSIPNTTPNSLQNIQGAFKTGENIIITTQDPISGPTVPTRQIVRGGSNVQNIMYNQISHSLSISWTGSISYQNKLNNSIITIPTSSLWQSGSIDVDLYPLFKNSIYTFNSDIIDTIYNNPNYKFIDIPSSGFNEVELPLTINPGDEFRFEGSEDETYMVGYSEIVSAGPIIGSDALIISFNNPIPPTLDLSKFSIRRYVDDASQIIFEGFRPNGSTGPYIIRPEYVVPELDKDIDAFIADLTQKGLL